jgi:hypothetical protein
MHAEPVALTDAEVSGLAVIAGDNSNLFVSQLVPSTGYGNSGTLPQAVDLPISDNQVEFGLAQTGVNSGVIIETDFQTSGEISLGYSIQNSGMPAIDYTFTSDAFRQAAGFDVTTNDFKIIFSDPEVSLHGDTLKLNLPSISGQLTPSGSATVAYIIKLFAVGDVIWALGLRPPLLQWVMDAVVVHAGFVEVPTRFCDKTPYKRNLGHVAVLLHSLFCFR